MKITIHGVEAWFRRADANYDKPRVSLREDGMSFAIPERHWPEILDAFDLSPAVLELTDYDFGQWCKARVSSAEALDIEEPSTNKLLEVAYLQVYVGETYDPDEQADVALELAKILEIALMRDIQAAGDWPRSRYRAVLLPRRHSDGSFWVDFAIYVGGVSTFLWLFFKDYEKVRSGILKFSEDMRRGLISLKPHSNRIPLEKVEPVILAITPGDKISMDENAIPELAWHTSDDELLESNPFKPEKLSRGS